MNSLLKRQIRKFLPKELQSNKELDQFLEAIDKSYSISEEQFLMLQRATKFSSDELYSANEQLREESDSQKNIISKLESVIDKLQFYDLKDDRPMENSDSLKLVDFIDNQTREIIRINQQKDILLKNLEHQNQELKEYTQMFSHDLRTPLQSVEALTTWLQEDYLDLIDESGNEKLELIKENVERMDIIVKGILQYSSIGNAYSDLIDISLAALVDTIIQDIDKKENVTFIIPKKLPTIKGDEYRLEKLFSHLIDNAIKFNNKENIIVEIGFKEEEDFWNFYIKDNGIGIEERYFDKIFVTFQKLEDDYSSSGIGLSIVKKVIELYKGEISIESTPKVGSTFYFSLKK
ncbi:ATP-binding protein [Polaribacter sp. Z014]|uniref:sensor histidine kinase n=1 Tax=unclassified Polaribacter TaxID=196858 RepID=UPI00193B5CBC|nr:MULTISPECIES: ATP-binding protein [unclassified Polaribacter]MCL7763582.1 ATP-binding protein [Polaribacter sp. Z014]QVY66648.1 GHKL domain-containing protein [Polaribacter sp. Q13]